MTTDERYAQYPSLRDRCVVVTGGASGIGEAMVEAFAGQGARVAFLDVDDAAASRLVERLSDRQGHAPDYGGERTAPLYGGERTAPLYGGERTAPLYVRCDLTDTEALRAAVERVTREMGAIRVLVNNAGNDQRHGVQEVTPEFWDRTMAVNLKHHFFMAQAVVPGMQEAGGGVIVNMSSISWVIPSTGLPVYVAAKAAIAGLTRTLAHEFGKDGIRVNCVLPGAIQTEKQERLWLTPEYKAEILSRQAIQRLIQPEEVARLVLFLAAEDSAAITNQSYVIDGGWV